ncbi:MAG TPA: glycosyltransferase family 2 protein [Dehalococcoidia bacterium]|nr:glycosyltransferase family 2 protein [Dehalococcoidia bacterium]
MEPARVGIVVVNWNGAEQTAECLRSLLALDHAERSTIVVVDNGSTDDSARRLRADFATVDVLALPKNAGYAGGCNAGVRYVQQRGVQYVWLLNNDTSVESDALDALLDAAGRRPRTIFAPKILRRDADGAGTIWSVGGTLRRPWLGRTLRGEGAHPGDYPDSVEVPWASGCSLFAAAEVFDAAGLLDERYFMYLEDVDWCLGAYRRGIATMFVPEARLWHGVSRSVRRLDPRIARYYDCRNYFLLAFRHGGVPGRLWAAGRYAVTALKIGVRVAVSPKHRRDSYYHAQTRALWDALRGRWGKAPYDDAPVDARPRSAVHEAVAT